MQQTKSVLQQLKPIHTPEPVSLWPQAPWIYALLAVVIIGFIGLSWYGWRQWQRYRRRRAIWQQFETLIKQFEQQPQQSITRLSQLMKRLLLTRYPREQIAHLHGEHWLIFLDQQLRTQEFTHGEGQILKTAPYQPQEKIQCDIYRLKPLFRKLLKQAHV